MAIRSLARSGVAGTKYINFLAGNEAFSPSAYDFIETVNGNGSSGTITFSSIPSTYTHLQIRFAASDTSNAYGELGVRVNGVSTNSYARHVLFGNMSTLATNSGSSQSSIKVLGFYGGVTTSPTAGIVDIANYSNTSVNKTVRAYVGTKGDYGEITLTGGFLPSTTAISSVSFVLSAGSFSTTSRFSLYGIKGA